MRLAACLFAVATAARAQERVAAPVWFDEIDPQSQADVLEYRKGAVAISVVLAPRTHTAEGSVVVSASWIACGERSATLVDQAGHRETLTGGCPPQAPAGGVFNSVKQSPTLGQILAHARSLDFVQGGHSVAIDLSGLPGAFQQAAAYQENAPAAATELPQEPPPSQ